MTLLLKKSIKLSIKLLFCLLSALEFTPLPHKSPTQHLINDRRDYFRVEGTVLMRYHAVDQNSALANHLPPQLKDDPGYSLIRELQLIDQEHIKFLRAIAEDNRDLEAYLKGMNKKIELLAGKLIEYEEPVLDQKKYTITLSEGGLSFHSDTEHAHDSYLAIQLTFSSSHMPLNVFCRVINCTHNNHNFTTALSFVNLQNNERQLIAKHIMQLQLAERRQQSNEQ